MNIRLAALLVATLIAQPVFAGQMPETEMDNLAGDTMHFPEDFNGKPTLVILAFAHEQRVEAGRVNMLLQKAQETNSSLSWYEMPIIDAPFFVHYFIKNGMRDGTDETLHAHMVPQFVDEDDWRKSTGITSTEPVLAKVDHEGKILKTVPLNAIKTESDITRF